jgi:hypothetical protein
MGLYYISLYDRFQNGILAFTIATVYVVFFPDGLCINFDDSLPYVTYGSIVQKEFDLVSSQYCVPMLKQANVGYR